MEWTLEELTKHMRDGRLVFLEQGQLWGDWIPPYSNGHHFSRATHASYFQERPLPEIAIEVSPLGGYLASHLGGDGVGIYTAAGELVCSTKNSAYDCLFMGEEPVLIYKHSDEDSNLWMLDPRADTPLCKTGPGGVLAARKDWVFINESGLFHVPSRTWHKSPLGRDAAFVGDFLLIVKVTDLWLYSLADGTSRLLYSSGDSIYLLQANRTNPRFVVFYTNALHMLDLKTLELTHLDKTHYQAMYFADKYLFLGKSDSSTFRWQRRYFFKQFELLGQLQGLVHLELANMKIEDATPLADCRELRHLDLRDNRIAEPPWVLSELPLERLYLFDNPCQDWMPKSLRLCQGEMNAQYIRGLY